MFTWVPRLPAKQGLLKAATIAAGATTLEANAALRSIVRRDSGESYQEFRRGLREVVADKGYHSNDALRDLTELESRSCINEPDRGRRNWCGKQLEQQAVYGKRRRMRGARGKRRPADIALS